MNDVKLYTFFGASDSSSVKWNTWTRVSFRYKIFLHFLDFFFSILLFPYMSHLLFLSPCVGGLYLQGYRVNEQTFSYKQSVIELKPPSEELKTFYFCAENETENQRWVKIYVFFLLYQSWKEPSKQTLFFSNFNSTSSVKYLLFFA